MFQRTRGPVASVPARAFLGFHARSELLPLIRHAAEHPARTAIVEAAGDLQLRRPRRGVRPDRLRLLGRDATDLAEARVAFLVPPGFDHVAVQWGIWRAGGIAVPLATSHPGRRSSST